MECGAGAAQRPLLRSGLALGSRGHGIVPVMGHGSTWVLAYRWSLRVVPYRFTCAAPSGTKQNLLHEEKISPSQLTPQCKHWLKR